MAARVQGALSAAWDEVRRDAWLLALTTWVPLLANLLLLATLWSPMPRDLPVGVVDQDKSSLSRQLARYVDSSPSLRVAGEYRGIAEARRDLSAGKVYALIVVPRNLKRDALEGRAPAITAFYNAQFLLIAKSIRSAVVEIEAQLSAEVDVARTLPNIPIMQGALGTDLPVRLQITALYNRALNYAQFLLPGMLAALLQVLCSSMCIVLLSRQRDANQARNPALAPSIVGPVGLCSAVFLLHGLIMGLIFFGILDWPRHGSLMFLLPAISLLTLSSALLGAFFLAAAEEPVRALSIAGAFSAPAFAFLGVTFPAADMSGFAQGWRDLMPASHFVDFYVSRVDYGVGQHGLFEMTAILVVLLALTPWMYKRLFGGRS